MLKAYVKPTLKCVELRAEERISGSTCHTYFIEKKNGNCPYTGYYA